MRWVVGLVSVVSALVVTLFVVQLVVTFRQNASEEAGFVRDTRDVFSEAYKTTDQYGSDMSDTIDTLTSQIKREKEALDAQRAVIDLLGETIRSPQEAVAAEGGVETETVSDKEEAVDEEEKENNLNAEASEE